MSTVDSASHKSMHKENNSMEKKDYTSRQEKTLQEELEAISLKRETLKIADLYRKAVREKDHDTMKNCTQFLYAHYYKWVCRVVSRTCGSYLNGDNYGDMVNSGFTGLVKALTKYGLNYTGDLDQVGSFSNYSLNYIKNEIVTQCNFEQHTSSAHYGKINKKVNSAIQEFKAEGLEPTSQMVAKKTGLSISQVETAMSFLSMKNYVPYDAQDREQPDTVSEFSDPEIAAEKREASETLRKCISNLSPKKVQALLLRFGFDQKGVRTFAQVGEALGIATGAAKPFVEEALAELRSQKEFQNIFGTVDDDDSLYSTSNITLSQANESSDEAINNILKAFSGIFTS